MQSQDELGNIINTAMFQNQEELKSKLSEVMDKAENLGAVSHTIGHLPNKGRIIVMDGLKYEVKFVDHKRGEIRLVLV